MRLELSQAECYWNGDSGQCLNLTPKIVNPHICSDICKAGKCPLVAPDHTDLIRRMSKRMRHDSDCSLVSSTCMGEIESDPDDDIQCTCGLDSLIAKANKILEGK